MEKTDLAKQFKSYYTATAQPQIVDIAHAQFLSIQGMGDPSGADFADSIQALYTAAYGIKFYYKYEGKDFVVAKLEGLWWFDQERFREIEMDEAPLKIPRSEWEYRLLIRMPDFVDRKLISEQLKGISTKKDNPLVNKVEWFEMQEGKCIQLLHIGPYSTEPASLQKIKDFSAKNKLQQNGLHHEIYLSDFRKTPAEKLKTILREPVK